MQARLVPAALILALALWVALQFVGLSLAQSAFEGPEDPEYYRNGLKYAQVLAAGKPGVPVRLIVPTAARAGEPSTIGVEGATRVRVGRPATLREDRVLEVRAGQVTTRLPQGWWIVRAGDSQARFWVAP